MSGDLWVLKGSGQVLSNVHTASRCAGRWCTIHNPMPGPWADWPMVFRDDRGYMERQCPHGIGHPAREDVINGFARGVHGCDGCCQRMKEKKTDER